jgi:hypothetical protein
MPRTARYAPPDGPPRALDRILGCGDIAALGDIVPSPPGRSAGASPRIVGRGGSFDARVARDRPDPIIPRASSLPNA